MSHVSHNLQERIKKTIFILSIIITIVILPFKLFVFLFSRQIEFTRKNISSINHILSRMSVNGFQLTILITSSSVILFCADCLPLYCFQLIHMNLLGTSFDNKWEILTRQYRILVFVFDVRRLPFTQNVHLWMVT